MRSLGLRCTRYIGLQKTSLQHVFTAATINPILLDTCWEGKKAAKTRTSRFAALIPIEITGSSEFPNGIIFGMTHNQHHSLQPIWSTYDTQRREASGVVHSIANVQYSPDPYHIAEYSDDAAQE